MSYLYLNNLVDDNIEENIEESEERYSFRDNTKLKRLNTEILPLKSKKDNEVMKLEKPL